MCARAHEGPGGSTARVRTPLALAQVSFARAYCARVKASGLVPASRVERWWELQQEALAGGEFFAHCVYYTYMAKAKPEAQIP